MKKTCKKVLSLAVFSALGYLCYKIFRLIRDAIELEKFLPKFFESHLGEKPEIKLTITCCKIILTARFSRETLDKHPDLQQTIIDYVSNYYPGLCLKKLKVILLEKPAEQAPEKENTDDSAVSENIATQQPAAEQSSPETEVNENVPPSRKRRTGKKKSKDQ